MGQGLEQSNTLGKHCGVPALQTPKHALCFKALLGARLSKRVSVFSYVSVMTSYFTLCLNLESCFLGRRGLGGAFLMFKGQHVTAGIMPGCPLINTLK